MDNKPSPGSRSGVTYTVRANPVMHESGDLIGKLDHVRFTADSGSGTHKEWCLDAALLDKTLHILESSGIRYQILSHLQSGARMDLPGKYSATQLTNLGYPTPR
jgi:hypothetical protein